MAQKSKEAHWSQGFCCGQEAAHPSDTGIWELVPKVKEPHYGRGGGSGESSFCCSSALSGARPKAQTTTGSLSDPLIQSQAVTTSCLCFPVNLSEMQPFHVYSAHFNSGIEEGARSKEKGTFSKTFP